MTKGSERTDVTDVKHAGYSIRYIEDKNVWKCWALELEATSLKALRQKINAIDANLRRVDNVRAIRTSEYGGDTPCLITLVDNDIECWITELGRGEKGYRRSNGRSKVPFRDLVLDNEENQAALRAIRAAKAAATKAHQKVVALAKALPRVTRAQLLELKVQKADELSHTGDE